MKYSDQLADWLIELGYTHCFFVGGGNIMHLTESLNRKIKCVPVIHEVAAGIAAEYFNEVSNDGKAFALVTAGPGLTNIMTAMAGSFLESRELLVIGGQVKTSDLLQGSLRQNGIQEIAGVNLVSSICKKSLRMDNIWSKKVFSDSVLQSSNGKKGPVFIEIPIDIQGREVDLDAFNIKEILAESLTEISKEDLDEVVIRLNKSDRPIILLGGGVSRAVVNQLYNKISDTSIPVVTTWNAADRLGVEHPNYCGRPNTWGQRSANVLMQQADLLIAIGTRLGMQQTGFNWQEFIPVGEVVQIDIDQSELEKGHPILSMGFAVDADDFFKKLLTHDLGSHSVWLNFCKKIRKELPLVEKGANKEFDGYVSPYKFIQKLSKLSNDKDIIIPCSSGSAFTIMMQVFEQKKGQLMVTNKGLASMGYGLSGAIGASIAYPQCRTVLIEGDGGFCQNLQEIGTAAINNLNLKVFILNDGGYASIRMTQKNYFSGNYVGCDTNTGLGLPNWKALFMAWGVKAVSIDEKCFNSGTYEDEFNKPGFSAFIVSIAPEQTYLPKISSKITKEGGMVSNPLHLMTPELSKATSDSVFKYINLDGENE